jgi:hypothetical protein
VDASNHWQRQRTSTRQNLRHSRARTDKRLKLLSRPPELLAACGDGLDGRELFDRKRPTFVSVNQSRKRIELARLARAWLCIPKLLDAAECLLVRAFVHDRFNHVVSNLVGIDAIVLCVSSDKTNENEKKRRVLDLRHETIRVALDVENNTVAREKICGAEDCAHLCRRGPRRLLDHGEPEAKGLFGIGVLSPKRDERVSAENPQLQ